MAGVPAEIKRIQVEAFRRMTPNERFLKLVDLMTSVSQLELADIKRRHPHADEKEIRMRLASRRIDPDLLRRATGWDVREKGY